MKILFQPRSLFPVLKERPTLTGILNVFNNEKGKTHFFQLASHKKIVSFLYLLLIFLAMNPTKTNAQENPTIYLIPGQGADYRLFSKLELNPNFKVKHIHYELPERNSSLPDYARQLSSQIDTTERFILIGASLGGMLATEINDFLNPELVILIGSAKSKKELPGRYRLQKYFPLYKIVPGGMSKQGALFLQPLVEPDRDKEKEIFVQMLKDKDPKFMRRTIDMIINWNRESYDSEIVHIHGDKDHTIPVKNVKYDYLIADGSHVMTLTRPRELSLLINELIAPLKI